MQFFACFSLAASKDAKATRSGTLLPALHGSAPTPPKLEHARAVSTPPTRVMMLKRSARILQNAALFALMSSRRWAAAPLTPTLGNNAASIARARPRPQAPQLRLRLKLLWCLLTLLRVKLLQQVLLLLRLLLVDATTRSGTLLLASHRSAPTPPKLEHARAVSTPPTRVMMLKRSARILQNAALFALMSSRRWAAAPLTPTLGNNAPSIARARPRPRAPQLRLRLKLLWCLLTLLRVKLLQQVLLLLRLLLVDATTRSETLLLASHRSAPTPPKLEHARAVSTPPTRVMMLKRSARILQNAALFALMSSRRWAAAPLTPTLGNNAASIARARPRPRAPQLRLRLKLLWCLLTLLRVKLLQQVLLLLRLLLVDATTRSETLLLASHRSAPTPPKLEHARAVSTPPTRVMMLKRSARILQNAALFALMSSRRWAAALLTPTLGNNAASIARARPRPRAPQLWLRLRLLLRNQLPQNQRFRNQRLRNQRLILRPHDRPFHRPTDRHLLMLLLKRRKRTRKGRRRRR